MKFKKFLIIILSVALLSCFAVSTFATSATTAATIPDYGFYISPGDYVIADNIYVIEGRSISLPFLFRLLDSNYVLMNFYLSSGVLNYVRSDGEILGAYFNGSWASDDYRYITVLEGFYIYDIYSYQWWVSNVTRVDSGYDNNLLDGILSSFTFIGEWIAGAANAVTPMFWDGEALTVVGTLSVAGLSFAVVFLLIALVSSFMKFRS